MRTKLKSVASGAVLDKTFRAGEKFRPVRTETRKMQYLYESGDEAVLMDLSDYDQLLAAAILGWRVARLDGSERRGRRAVRGRPADRHSGAERGGARGHEDSAAFAVTRFGRRNETGDARVRGDRAGAAVRQRR